MTVIQATFIGVGSMVGAGIFALLGAAGAVAGSAVWVSFLIAGAIAGLQGYSFAKLGSVYPSGGGMLTYLSKGFGEGHLTGITSWLFFVTAGIVTAMVATSFGGYASSVLTDDDPLLWNQYDLITGGLGNVSFTFPIDQVRVDALTGGTWAVDGTGSPVLTGATWQLGTLTAGLHAAVADGHGLPDMAPRPATRDELRSWAAAAHGV